MKTFVGLLLSSATFAASIAVVYWFSSHEPAGTLLLGLMMLALAFAAGYAILAERGAHLAGDYPTQTPQDTAGEDLGIVTSHSAWPFLLAVSILWLLIGIVWSDFMIFSGAAAVLLILWRLGAESARISFTRIPVKGGPDDVT